MSNIKSINIEESKNNEDDDEDVDKGGGDEESTLSNTPNKTDFFIIQSKGSLHHTELSQIL